MRALLVLFGAILGIALSRGGDTLRLVLCGAATLVLAFYAFKKRSVVYFLVPLGSAVLIGLLCFWFPCPEGKVSFQGIVIKTGDNYVIVQEWFRRYYVGVSNHTYEVGDVLSLKGTSAPLRMTTYESAFSFSSYLEDLGVRYELNYAKVGTVFSTPLRIRTWELNFLNHFEGHGRALLDSLLFGRKDYDDDLIVKADEMNVLFVLSSSGLFYSFTLRLLEKAIGERCGGYGDVIALAFGTLFLPFSFQKIGILRVYAMRAFSVIDKRFLHWDVPYLERLCLVMMGLLALDPRNAIQVGFLAGLGISLFMNYGSQLWKQKNKILDRLLGMAMIRLFLLPMNLSGSGNLHLFGMVFSLILLPLNYLVLVLGWLSFFTFPFTPVLNGLGEAVYGTLNGFSIVDVAIPLPIPSFFVIVTFYVLITLVIYLTETGYQHLRNGIIIGAVSLYCASLIPLYPMVTQSVSFINVGQGDCALVQDGLTTVMIDTGGVVGKDLAQESLIPYLRKRRIYHLDAVIASHQDYDHVGALSSLSAHFPVRSYVTEPTEFPLTVGGLRFENHNHYGASDENDKSLVLSLAFMGKSWVFTGDAPIWVEKRIAEDYPDLDCDILKVGHHGSDTSTCAEWLDLLTPEEAVVSCGAKNRYGHPKESVLALLRSRGIKIRRTDLEGTITYARLRQ